MTRLRQWLTLAAGLVITGGLALGVALNQAGQQLDPPGTCAEWDRRLDEIAQQPTITAFVALADGYAPPVAVDNYVLGSCAAGVCTVKPLSCGRAYTYSYTRSPLVGGWRLHRFEAHGYFAAGWQALATTDPASVRFFSGWKEAAGACVTSGLTAVQCRALADGAGVCWRRGAQICRGGLLYGPGLGGVDAQGNLVTCTAQAGDTPYPCGDEGRGRDWAESAGTTAYADGEP